jgi:hypothetical protein
MSAHRQARGRGKRLRGRISKGYPEMKLFIAILIFLAGIMVGRHYVERDCIEVTIHNPLEDYDPITLMKGVGK